MPEIPRLLCVHPHPDDESIACGGVLARAAARGATTVVVTCTGGEAGENLAGIDLGGQALSQHRRRELADALEVLDVSEHVWLGYRDSGMAGTADNEHPDAFAAADVEEASRRLAAVVRRVRPQVVVSDDEQGTYGHPDHVRAHHVTRRAVELAGDASAELDGLEPWSVAKRYVHALCVERLLAMHRALRSAGLASPFGEQPELDPAELPFGVPEARITTRVDVRAELDRKRAALRAHRSQISHDSFFFNLPDDLAREVFGWEEFVLERGRAADAEGRATREADLFAGLPVTWPADDGG